MFCYWLVRSCFISYDVALACRILLFSIVCCGFGLSDLSVFDRMFRFWLVGSCCFISYVLGFFFGLSDLVLYRMFLIYFGLSDLVVFYCMFFLWLVGSCYLIYFSF